MDLRQLRCTLPVFTMYGCSFSSVYTIMITGAEDFLAGTDLPTSLVTFTENAFSAAAFLVSGLFLVRNVSFALKYSLAVALTCCSLLSFSLVVDVYWKLCSFGFTVFGYSLAYSAGLESVSEYGPVAVSSMSLGSAFGLILGPLYYTGKTDGTMEFVANYILCCPKHGGYQAKLI